VGASFQILEILKYSSGLKFGSSANLNQNPIFKPVHIMTVPADKNFILTDILCWTCNFPIRENDAQKTPKIVTRALNLGQDFSFLLKLM
jgi:hypothetical protein